MRILKGEEAESLLIVRSGRISKVGAMASQLQVGEALEILKSDWKGKHSPYNSINRLAKKTGRKFIKGRLPDGSGWGVKRVA